ncbi:hypothetical protein [Schaalia suimastitidis]|uniref:variant leucine-rich repeat-containing protein n=1 Tax=Schaalia suimastitidis TaxID=121163 RepID=UPI0004209505|nr:hypothetical protein [Schaalia suimastitidis]
MSTQGPFDSHVAAVHNPTTPPAELEQIAFARPDLHAVIAAHPAAPVQLLQWLSQSRDPHVQAALAARTAPTAIPSGVPAEASLPSAAQPGDVPVPEPPTAAPAPADAIPTHIAEAASSSAQPAPFVPGQNSPAQPAPFAPGQNPAAGFPASFTSAASGQPTTPVSTYGDASAGTPGSKRSISTPVIVTLSVAAFLVVALIATGLWMLLRGSFSVGGSDASFTAVTPVNEWSAGGTEIGSVNTSSLVAASDNLVALIDYEPTPATVTLYEIADGGANVRWTAELDDYNGYGAGFWQDRLVVNSTLFDLQTGDGAPAPWAQTDAEDLYIYGGVVVVNTYEEGIQGWNSVDASTAAWSVDDNNDDLYVGMVANFDGVTHATLISSENSTQEMIVNLSNGEASQIDIDEPTVLDFNFAVTDAFGIALEDDSSGTTIVWVDQSGKEFDRSENVDTEAIFTSMPLLTHGFVNFTEAKAWIENGDTSFADATSTVSESCDEITVDGVKLDIDEFDVSCDSPFFYLTEDHATLIGSYGIFDAKTGARIDDYGAEAYYADMKSSKALVVEVEDGMYKVYVPAK